jgi:hypothetical protein
LVIGWRCITPGRPEIDQREALAGQESKMAAELICGPPAKVCFRDEIAERNVALGKELLALRSKAASNREFGRLRSQQFDIDAMHAAEAMRVARLYGERPEVYAG